MAWIETRNLKSGTVFYVAYQTAKGARHKVTGFSGKQAAQNFCFNLERAELIQRTGKDMPPVLVEWIDDLSDEVHAQLVTDGFLPKRIKPGDLKDLAEYFLKGKDSQEELKESTLRARKVYVHRWFEFFGKHRSVMDITRDDARQYAEWHATKYAPATWGREVKALKLIFNFAVDELRWIKENPFRKLKGGNQSNKEKLHAVTLEESQRILEECPTAEMRLVFCLARFGGLRVPSELAALEWDCVNFKRNTLTVNIPKKTRKKAEAKGEYATRVIPLWPELRQAFNEYWETLPEGAPLKVFPDCPTGQALTHRFERILKRAGVPMWGNFFKSMRATRDTELRNKFPAHKVNEWIGHTQAVAENHYILNPVQEMETASEFVTMESAAKNPVVNFVVNSVVNSVVKQNFSDSCKQNSEVKKTLEKTRPNNSTKKGLASLQTPEMTSMGRTPGASCPVNYDTCDTPTPLRGQFFGGQDIKAQILDLFHTLDNAEQIEILFQLQAILLKTEIRS